MDHPLSGQTTVHCQLSVDTVRRGVVTLDPCALALAHDPTLLAWSQHMVAEGLATATRRVRLGTVKGVCRLSGVEPLALAVPHVTAYLAASDFAAWTRRKYLEHCRHFGAFAGIPDPTAGLRPPPQPRGLPRPISEPDLARLLSATIGPERAWVLLGAFCGLRSAESSRVRETDIINGTTGRLLRVDGKGGREDLLPLPPVVDEELAQWAELVARWSDDGRLWFASPHTVQQRIRRAGERAGVRVTSHMLRHRYGTQLYRTSRDLLATQRLMRHSSPTITQIYVELDDAETRQLALALPGACDRLSA